MNSFKSTILKFSHLFLSLSFFQLLQRVLANELRHHFLKKTITQNLSNHVEHERRYSKQFKDTSGSVCRVFYLHF